jgi:ATP-grasp domain, R2K clade family 3
VNILYPSNPLNRNEPDELYAEEYAAALDLGFEVSLFRFEEFLAGSFRVRPSLPPGQPVLYRGWMLTPQHYARLHSEIVRLGATMLTSPEQYERCHYLPGWYAKLQEFTPETHLFQESDNVATRLRELTWSECFLKDYVKSLSVEGGSMVRDLARIPEAIAKMKAYWGEIEGGLCARRIEDFNPETEERYFVFGGKPFSRDDFIPEVVRVAASRVDSPFFTADTVLRRDGITRIIELGDGQVSDRKKWSAVQLLSVFKHSI